MRDIDFENLSCRHCRVAYPAYRRTCPCCNDYNPAYLADPAGNFSNHDDDFTETDFYFNDDEEACPY